MCGHGNGGDLGAYLLLIQTFNKPCHLQLPMLQTSEGLRATVPLLPGFCSTNRLLLNSAGLSFHLSLNDEVVVICFPSSKIFVDISHLFLYFLQFSILLGLYLFCYFTDVLGGCQDGKEITVYIISIFNWKSLLISIV